MSIVEILPTDVIGTYLLVTIEEQGKQVWPCYSELLGDLRVGDRVRMRVRRGWVKWIRRV